MGLIEMVAVFVVFVQTLSRVIEAQGVSVGRGKGHIVRKREEDKAGLNGEDFVGRSPIVDELSIKDESRGISETPSRKRQKKEEGTQR